MTYDEVQAERAEYAQRLVAKLKAHYGAPFEELVSILEKSDDLIDAMVERANTAAPEDDEKVQEMTLDLLRFLADGFGGRAGFYSGTATITYGVRPSTVFHSLQTSHHLGLEQATRGHREGCQDPTCTAPAPLERFLHNMRLMMMRGLHEAEETAELERASGFPAHPPPLKH